MLVEEYGNERERMVRGAAQLRAETVRAILAGEPIDEELAVRRLGYELRRHHVALRVSSSGERGARPRARGERGGGRARSRGAAGGAIGRREPRCLVGRVRAAGLRALERYAPPEGVRVALGASGQGVAGFRRSHADAVQAARVAALAGDALGR